MRNGRKKYTFFRVGQMEKVVSCNWMIKGWSWMAGLRVWGTQSFGPWVVECAGCFHSWAFQDEEFVWGFYSVHVKALTNIVSQVLRGTIQIYIYILSVWVCVSSSMINLFLFRINSPPVLLRILENLRGHIIDRAAEFPKSCDWGRLIITRCTSWLWKCKYILYIR